MENINNKGISKNIADFEEGDRVIVYQGCNIGQDRPFFATIIGPAIMPGFMVMVESEMYATDNSIPAVQLRQSLEGSRVFVTEFDARAVVMELAGHKTGINYDYSFEIGDEVIVYEGLNIQSAFLDTPFKGRVLDVINNQIEISPDGFDSKGEGYWIYAEHDRKMRVIKLPKEDATEDPNTQTKSADLGDY